MVVAQMEVRVEEGAVGVEEEAEVEAGPPRDSSSRRWMWTMAQLQLLNLSSSSSLPLDPHSRLPLHALSRPLTASSPPPTRSSRA